MELHTIVIVGEDETDEGLGGASEGTAQEELLLKAIDKNRGQGGQRKRCLLDVGTEVIHQVLSFCHTSDIIALGEVGSSYRKLTDDRRVWIDRFHDADSNNQIQETHVDDILEEYPPEKRAELAYFVRTILSNFRSLNGKDAYRAIRRELARKIKQDKVCFPVGLRHPIGRGNTRFGVCLCR